jgi:hypothetical protein
LEAWSSFRGFFPGGRSTRLRPAEGLAAAPGGAAAVIQIIKEVNIAQKKQGEADQGAYPREAENEAQELGSQKSEKQPEKKVKDRLHRHKRPFLRYEFKLAGNMGGVGIAGEGGRLTSPGFLLRWLSGKKPGLRNYPGPFLSGLPEAATYFPQQPPRLKKNMATTAAIARMVNQFISHILGLFDVS